MKPPFIHRVVGAVWTLPVAGILLAERLLAQLGLSNALISIYNGLARRVPSQRPRLLARIAFLQELGGRAEAALASYQEVLRLDPHAIGHYVDLARLYERLQQSERAIANYETAVRLGAYFTERLKGELRDRIQKLKGT